MMKSSTSVSVVIIFLNAERFLDEAIASVFAQTYEDWELLLVDDGSTDGGTAIAREYAQRYPNKIQYLTHEGHINRGMSASRNLGISHAAGDYVAFLDADDVWLPYKLEEQVAILSSHPDAVMVYGPTEWWYSWTGAPVDRERDFVLPLGVTPGTLVQPPTLLTRFLEHEGISPCTCSVLIRREAIDRVGGFEEEFRTLYEDQAFFAKVCLHLPVYVSDRCWCRYRQHRDTSCAVAERTGQARAMRGAFLRWLRAYLRRHTVRDPDLWRALDRELRPYRYPTLYLLGARVSKILSDRF